MGCDVAVKMGKLHLGGDKAPPKIVFEFQTFKGEQKTLNAPGKPDGVIDVEPETEESG